MIRFSSSPNEHSLAHGKVSNFEMAQGGAVFILALGDERFHGLSVNRVVAAPYEPRWSKQKGSRFT